MMFFFSKLLPVFIFPLGLSLVLLIAALLICLRSGNRSWTVGLLIALPALLLWLAACPYLSHKLLAPLEFSCESRKISQYPPGEAIVVLGGGVAAGRRHEKEVSPAEAFDRLFLAYQLLESGKAPVIILSGGLVPWQHQAGALTEARRMAELLLSLNVPAGRILLEERSRNTRENAIYTKQLLEERGISRVLLVTSAFHMKRARACFTRLGIDVIPCPADFRTDFFKRITVLDFFPDAGALNMTTRVMRENVGILYYQLRGWI